MSLPEPTPDPEPEPEEPSNNPASAGDVPTNLPPPVLTGPSAADARPKYTAGDWGMFALGVFVAILSPITYLLGSIGLLVWFFVARPPRPPFLRGIGLGLAIVGALLLGAFTLCLIMLGANSSGIH